MFFILGILAFFSYFIGIGPAVGDLSKKDCKNAMPDCYSFSNGLKKNIQQYLNDFKNINKGDIIVMPVKGRNFFYIGQVNVCYHYEHNAGARKYYECAHRIGVCWDKDYEGKFIPHGLDRLNMTNQGGWWIKAFSKIINKCTIKKINNLLVKNSI